MAGLVTLAQRRDGAGKRSAMPLRPALARALAAAFLALSPAAAHAAVTTMRCVNPYSGAAWEVKIDEQNQRVDTFPAAITAERAEWRDTVGGGIYSLDRASGALTGRWPSSTGGYFLRYRCTPR